MLLKTDYIDFSYPTTLRTAKCVDLWANVTYGRRFKWLQNIALKLLKRLGASNIIQETVETVSYGPLKNNDKLSDAIFRALDSLFDVRHLDEYAPMIVIGRDAYRELFSDKDVQHIFRFDHQTKIHYRGTDYIAECHNYKTQIYDIPVLVVPWMTGFTVLPRPMVEIIKENTEK